MTEGNIPTRFGAVLPDDWSISRRARPWEAGSPWAYATITATLLAVLTLDLLIPLGYTVWVLYLIPVAISLWTWRPFLPLVIAGVASTLMLTMYFVGTNSASQREAVRLSLEVVRVNRGLGISTLWIMGVVGYHFIQAKRAVQREEWLQAGQAGLNVAVRGELHKEQLGENILGFLADHLLAHAGAIYAGAGGEFRRLATYGVAAGGAKETFNARDGLLGQVTKDRRIIVIDEVPAGYLNVASAFGGGAPRSLLIAPASVDGVVNTVVELGFMGPVFPEAIELLRRSSESVGVAVRSSRYRDHLQKLLDETQRQAEELKAQGEELRVSNEELAEQSRSLMESQSRLELQQTELEQSNAQLEEQTQVLESQRDALAATKAELQLRARELEQASQYKSDFLANMSHELRTPLNSSLILSKLLADNPTGNLTAEQVRYAQTIQSSGNDLLNLINDILDISKIEAGRLEIHPEPVDVVDLVEGLRRGFIPIAEGKGLAFETKTSGAPATFRTDRQRLEQVLKNLLANALKFTERGVVSLEVRSTGPDRVDFVVADTGIGIPSHQQDVIFEAFRQADGTTNRKYGGTGLGLSISRQLARLLSGEIRLSSEPGRGSTFTVSLPSLAEVPAPPPRGPEPRHDATPAVAPPPPRRPAPARPPEPFAAAARRLDDDRDRLDGESLVILVVEDDEKFARILYDLAHELKFQCLLAATAEDALATAVEHLPHAVVLDVGLPDQSGLSVLDRIKHDARTRHIPVHVVSAGDYAQTALSLGAVGYMLKPVKREELVQALSSLEHRISRRMRSVLVVEDDPVQLESLRKLLGTRDVQTVGASSAAECLEKLRATTFDCMVLDLTLPDASGYALLETLSREDAYSFPPVIVYTGRELSTDEEHRLRRYSKSIIIKGAKSPERLLDEVTLFLHQVVSELPSEQQKMLEKARSRDAALEDRRILVVEDDVRNVFALTSVLEPRGAIVQIARNGVEALAAVEKSAADPSRRIDLILMDVMMPEMDGLTATRELRKRPEGKKLPIIMLTAKAMKDDQEQCLAAGANDYMAKPLEVERLLSLVRVWMPR